MKAGIPERYQRIVPRVSIRLDSSASSGKLPPHVTEGKVVIACRSAGPVEVVSLSGTLDAWSEQEVRATLKDLLGGEGFASSSTSVPCAGSTRPASRRSSLSSRPPGPQEATSSSSAPRPRSLRSFA